MKSNTLTWFRISLWRSHITGLSIFVFFLLGMFGIITEYVTTIMFAGILCLHPVLLVIKKKTKKQLEKIHVDQLQLWIDSIEEMKQTAQDGRPVIKKAVSSIFHIQHSLFLNRRYYEEIAKILISLCIEEDDNIPLERANLLFLISEIQARIASSDKDLEKSIWNEIDWEMADCIKHSPELWDHLDAVLLAQKHWLRQLKWEHKMFGVSGSAAYDAFEDALACAYPPFSKKFDLFDFFLYVAEKSDDLNKSVILHPSLEKRIHHFFALAENARLNFSSEATQEELEEIRNRWWDDVENCLNYLIKEREIGWLAVLRNIFEAEPEIQKVIDNFLLHQATFLTKEECQTLQEHYQIPCLSA